jgi:hypothetical protein
MPGGMTFHIFQASTDSGLFLITDRENPPDLPQCPKRGIWKPFKIVPESGRPRVGFSEADAKVDIAKQGYHLADVRISTRAFDGARKRQA